MFRPVPSAHWVLPALVVLSAQIVLAQDDSTPTLQGAPEDAPLDEIVVFGRRIDRRSPTGESDAVSVIGRSELERVPAQTVADVLRQRAGVDVRSTGGPGSQTTVSLRGSESDQVQVLIDGVRVDSSTTGAFNFANLSARDIERVEVLRGPQSTLYGANAVGGVIQIFTRQGEGPPTATAYAGFGNDAQREAGLRLSGATASGLRYSAFADQSSIAPVSAFRPHPAPQSGLEIDGYRNRTLGARLSFPLGAGEASVFWRSSESGADLDNSRSDNPSFRQKTRQRLFGAEVRYPVTPTWSAQLRYSENHDDVRGRDPSRDFNNFDVDSESRLATLTNEVSLGPFDLQGGVDLEVEHGRNPGAGIRDSTTQTGVFSRLAYQSERMGLSAGVRHEVSSRTKSSTTYQLGARVGLGDGIDLLANYGTAFRAPTLNELFFQDPFARGNPDLDPETSRGGDLGLRVRQRIDTHAAVRLELRAFAQTYSDLIEFRSAGDGILRPINVERARSRGLETRMRLEWTGDTEQELWLEAEYTHLRARDDQDFRLRRRSDDAARVTLGGRLRAWRASASLQLAGASFSRNSERDRVSGHSRVDLFLAYRISEHFELRARVRNLTDERIEEVFQRGSVGRTYAVTLEARY